MTLCLYQQWNAIAWSIVKGIWKPPSDSCALSCIIGLRSSTDPTDREAVRMLEAMREQPPRTWTRLLDVMAELRAFNRMDAK
jgi:hypothetical protein